MSDLLVALLCGVTLAAGALGKVLFDVARRAWIARKAPHAPALLEVHGALLHLISGGNHEGRMDELVKVILATNQAVVEKLLAEQQAHVEKLVQVLKDTNDEVIHHFASHRSQPPVPEELALARRAVAAQETPQVWNFTPSVQTPKQE